MKKNSLPFAAVAVRTVAVTALLAALAFASVQALAAKASAEDRVELRIGELRAQIHITPAQEAQWSKVTEVMRDNAKKQDALIQARLAHAATLTAVDDMKSYGEIATAHVEGIQRLLPVFAALYDSMSPAQKKEADEAFLHGHDHAKHPKH